MSRYAGVKRTTAMGAAMVMVATVIGALVAGTSAPVGAASSGAGPTVVRVGDATIVEPSAGKQTVAVPIALSAPLDHDLELAVVTPGLEAAAPTDYKAVATPKLVKIARGKTTATVGVPVFGDRLDESAERFTVEITGTKDPAVVVGAPGTVTIVDSAHGDDAEVQVGSTTAFEADIGRTVAKVAVTLSKPLTHDLVVGIETTDEGAQGGHDYRHVVKPVRVRAGRMGATIGVSVLGDDEREGDETFALRIGDLSDGSVRVGEHGRGVVTIRDDEPPESPGSIYSYLFGTPVVLAGPGSPGWVHVAWDEPIGGGAADDYVLELSRDNATWMPLATTASRSFDHFCGLYNLLCQYRVTARNAGGDGSTSFLGAVVTQAPARPGAPADVEASLLGPSAPGLVALAWDPPTGGGPVEVYRVDWRDSNGEWQEIYYGGGRTTSHDCGVPAVDCDYRVTAINTGGASAAAAVQTTTQTTPGAPRDMVATPTPELRSVHVTWAPPVADGGAEVTGYQLRYTGDADDSGQPPSSAAWTTIDTADLAVRIDSCSRELFGSARCWIQVRAGNAFGFGAWSTVTAVGTWVSPPPGPVEQPAAVLVGASAPGWATVSWTAPLGDGIAETYEVEVMRTDGPWQLLGTTTGHEVDHHCGLYELTCVYRVTAHGPGGVGPVTLVGSVTTQAPSPPGPVHSARAQMTGTESLGLVELSWAPPITGGLAQRYRVDWSDSPGTWHTVYNGADLHTQHLCGVPSVTCSYRITALNGGGDGPTVTVSVTSQGAPAMPANLTGSAIIDTRTVQLTWAPRTDDGGAPIVRFRVRATTDIDLSGVAWWNAAWNTFVTTASSSATVTCPATSYGPARCRFEVRAENAVGTGPWSDGVVVATFRSRPHDPKPGGNGPSPDG